MQFEPSAWRAESAAAPGGPRDLYQPAAATVTAGSYLHRLETGAARWRSTAAAWLTRTRS